MVSCNLQIIRHNSNKFINSYLEANTMFHSPVGLCVCVYRIVHSLVIFSVALVGSCKSLL